MEFFTQAMIKSLFILLLMLSFHWLNALEQVSLKIKNLADLSVDIFWIPAHVVPDNRYRYDIKDLKRMTASSLNSGSEHTYQSYNGHKFLVRFSDQYKLSAEEVFVKSANPETLYISCDNAHKSIEVASNPPVISKSDVELKPKRFNNIINLFKHSTNICSKKMLKGLEYEKCLYNEMSPDFQSHVKRAEAIDKMFDKVSDHYRNYTCLDASRETTQSISSYNYIGNYNKTYIVNVILNRSHAKVWTVDDMISEDECEMLIKDGRPNLQAATTAGRDGKSEVNKVRKAQQAVYDFKGTSDPLWNVYTNIMDLQNQHTGYGLQLGGQEPFVNIQYNPNDEYRPHCDSNCDGKPHVAGGRVATAVVYCKVPEKGGGTFFTKSDIYVKPKKGSVTFFSYWGPDNMNDPEELTEHSGCPVLEGEKWITTFWMREGVSKDYPWTILDPRGNRIDIFKDDTN